MAKAKQTEPKPLVTYNLPGPSPFNHPQWQMLSPDQRQLLIEMRAFRIKWPIEKGGLPRYEHFRNGVKLLWPWIEFDPWMELQCEAFCNHSFVGVAGAASSGKTTTSVIYGTWWWLCGMDDSAMVLTSTTKGNIRQRAWNWVQRLYTKIPGSRVGNMVDSRTTWQREKGDDRHSISAIAVREGSTNKAVARIQGFHPDGRMLVIIDEATDTPEAIFEALPNLMAGNWDFGVIALGNPASRFDPFGKFITPLNGWKSVSVDDESWETEKQVNGRTGLALHLDGMKSPNVLAGQRLYKHLPTLQSLDGIRGRYGENSPAWWKFGRGFLAPEGIVQTVLTESMIQKHDAAGNTKHIFIGPVFTVAFLDPAFGGGDRAVLRFAKCGEVEGGGMGIQLTKSEYLNLSAQMKDEDGKPIPLHFQISKQAVWHCRDQGVEPNHFGLDSTGEGGGLADIISREWSSEIHRVEFGGAPSDKRVSNEDDRLCSEAYDRKVTELHFTVKEFVVANQLRGMNAKEAADLCNRIWRMKGKKIEIEPKSNRKSTGDAEEAGNWGFKSRLGRSPDDGDALCGLCEVAKRVGVGVKAQGKTANAGRDWERMARRLDSIYAEPEENETGGQTIWPATHDDIYALNDI